MKIKELIYKTPEMSEERLLNIIDENLEMLNNNVFLDRIRELHKNSPINESILNEYDLIQDKKSFLSKSQRDIIVGFVGLCLIKMTKNNGE